MNELEEHVLDLLMKRKSKHGQEFACLSCGSIMSLENVLGDISDGRPVFGCPFCLRYGGILKLENREDWAEYIRCLE